MKQIDLTASVDLRFITIWIFARMKPKAEIEERLNSFITIWIFARMKHSC